MKSKHEHRKLAYFSYGDAICSFMIVRTFDSDCLRQGKGKGKVCIRANVARQAGAYPGFRSMKRLGVFPPGWDATPSQGYPPALNSPVPIYTPGWREGRESKVSCPRTQHNIPGQGSNPDRLLRGRAH